MREGGVDQVEQAFWVDGNHSFPFVDVRADDRAEQHEAGVVDQDVGASKSFDDGGDGLIGRAAVGDIDFNSEGSSTGGLNLGDDGVKAVLAARDDRDVGAVLGQTDRGGLTDTITRAGDNGDGSG